jgi:beta-glucanase (GH16 family)
MESTTDWKISACSALLVAALATVALVGACAVTSRTQAPIDIPGYQLVWSDEFATDGRPDPQNWTYENGFVRNRELQWYQPENAYVRDGLLIIEARRDTFPNPAYDPAADDWRKQRERVEYTSASLTTQGLQEWTYGRFEIRAKIRAEAGLWPAIWTLGSGHRWPEGGEIDLLEYYDGLILANAAWAGSDPRVTWDDARLPIAELGPDWDRDFHVWRMDWTPIEIRLSVDDRLLNTIPLDSTLNQRGPITNPFRETRHYLLLNLAIGSNGGDPSETDFPSVYTIDYVRVYQRS